MQNIKDPNLLWNTILPALEKSFTRPIYETLLTSVKPLAIQSGTFQIAVPNDVVRQWLSRHCLTLLLDEVRSIDQTITLVEFVVGPKELFNTPPIEKTKSEKYVEAHVEEEKVEVNPFAININPRYTFDTFVIGNGNRFAHAASLAVGNAPGTAYNPLFLYGGVGLGKTHLMQAIGHLILQKNPRAKVLYLTSETFTNELIASIKENRMNEFRNKYRNIDVLMVDDIQFIAGKERTQEEFFHTFNTLHESRKQIIVSSDRPPKEIPTIEERLRSRFEWGLIADIQSPDYETRIAILKKKCEMSEIVVSDDVLSFIASRVTSNIRELEGALIRVVAFASLNDKPIDILLVESALKATYGQAGGGGGPITFDMIKKVAAEYYSIKFDDMSAKVRTKEIANARQVAMFLCRELTESSLPKIGEEFGGRDHTTVLYAIDKIKHMIKKNKDLAEAVKVISENIKKLTAAA